MLKAIKSLWSVLNSPVKQELFEGDPASLASMMTEYYQSAESRAYYESLDSKGVDDADFRDMCRRAQFSVLCSQSRDIVDFGCGAGNLAASIAMHYPDNSVLGVDIGSSAEQIMQSKTRGLKNLRFQRANLLQSGLPGSSFDLVISRFVIEHVPYPAELMVEMSRILRPNGSLFLVYPHLMLTARRKAVWREITALCSGSTRITYLKPDFTGTPCADKDAVWLSNHIRLARLCRANSLVVTVNKPSQSMIIALKRS